ncbi:MAG: acyl carrier protein [Lachnospiraceae bacterium]|nr:acyl carrier protein [Lachnospiraceae bacterium]
MEQKVLAVLNEEFPWIDFESSNALWDDKILDSVTLIGIIETLNSEFDIVITYVDIIEDNFNSIAGMARLVSRLLEEKK